jgi:hypothetical protein
LVASASFDDEHPRFLGFAAFSFDRRVLLTIEALPVWKSAKAELASRMGVRNLWSAQRAMAELAEAAETTSSAPAEPQGTSRSYSRSK